MTIAHGCCTDTYSLHKLFYLNLFSYSYTYQTSHSNLNLSLYNYEFHPTDLLLAHLLSVEVSPTFSHIYIFAFHMDQCNCTDTSHCFELLLLFIILVPYCLFLNLPLSAPSFSERREPPLSIISHIQ